MFIMTLLRCAATKASKDGTWSGSFRVAGRGAWTPDPPEHMTFYHTFSFSNKSFEDDGFKIKQSGQKTKQHHLSRNCAARAR